MDENYTFPEELKYAKTHEWVKISDETALMGITDYAQYQLGDIVYVELPQKGGTFEKGEPLGEIESVKAVDEFYMPLTGEIMEVNEALEDNPEYVNQSPYDKGWFLKIKFSNLGEIEELITSNAYEELTKKEEK